MFWDNFRGMEATTKKKPLFGQRLAELRKAKRLTQPQLAEELGLTRDVIAYYETKAQNPTIEFIQQIADYFEVPVAELVSEMDVARKKPGPKSQVDERFERVRALPRAQQQTVIAVLDTLLETMPGSR